MREKKITEINDDERANKIHKTIIRVVHIACILLYILTIAIAYYAGGVEIFFMREFQKIGGGILAIIGVFHFFLLRILKTCKVTTYQITK